MIVGIKRDKLVMTTDTKLRVAPGESVDGESEIRFPVVATIGSKQVSITDLIVGFEPVGSELIGKISMAYYDSVDGQPKCHPLTQFKVNIEQILLNNGIEKTNQNEQDLTVSSIKQKKNSTTGEQ